MNYLLILTDTVLVEAVLPTEFTSSNSLEAIKAMIGFNNLTFINAT